MFLRRAVDQPNRCAFRCRANVNGERVAVLRAAGKLFQMAEPATAKLLCPVWSLFLVLTVSRCQQWQRLPNSRSPSYRGLCLFVVEHVMKSLQSIESTDEKLSALCKKYAELLEEHRNTQSSLKQTQRTLSVVSIIDSHYLSYYYLRLTATFPGEPRNMVPPRVHLFRKRSSMD